MSLLRVCFGIFASHFSAQTRENHLPKSCYYLSPLESSQTQSFLPLSREGHKFQSCSFAFCQYVGLMLLLSGINYQRVRNTDSCAPTMIDKTFQKLSTAVLDSSIAENIAETAMLEVLCHF